MQIVNTGTNKKTEASAAIMSLIDVLNHFHPLNEGIEKYLQEKTYSCFFSRGKLLLKAGQVCENIYFIKKGAVRGFIREGHKDITTWITAENELVTSISGLDGREPALENMQAIENCEMLALSHSDLQDIYLEFPEFNIVTRKLLQQYYRDAEGRAFIARLTNAESKYKHFLNYHSHLVNRIPLKYVASFLGITIETLSRVRKKISVHKN
ncbi:MAG: Crp/Fnr family transcriptional regulator [Chitinophagales bacterium]